MKNLFWMISVISIAGLPSLAFAECHKNEPGVVGDNTLSKELPGDVASNEATDKASTDAKTRQGNSTPTTPNP